MSNNRIINIEKKYKIYIYGAGNMYNRLSDYLRFQRNRIIVLGIVTTTKLPYYTIDGYNCFSVNEVDLNEADFVVVAIEKWEEIRDFLLKKGVLRKKIIRDKVFELPNFDIEEYVELINSRVTIFSNYCLGGMLYHELGLEILSPTINMFCTGKDYLEFLENYEYYLDCEMKELSSDCDRELSQKIGEVYASVPKGILGEKLVWVFNHDVDLSEAIVKWNIRKNRVNKQNVVAIMIIHSEEDAYQFEKLSIKRKIGIYYKDLHIKQVIYCPEWNDIQIRDRFGGSWHSYANNYMLDTKGFASPINWIKFLLGKEDYIRRI